MDDSVIRLRAAIAKMRQRSIPEERENFWGSAVKIFTDRELDTIESVVHLNELLLAHIEETYGIPKLTVLDALEDRLNG